VGRQRRDLGERDRVGDHLLRVVVVELDEGHASGDTAGGRLLGQQGVEALDHVGGHRGHRAGAVEQHVQVERGCVVRFHAGDRTNRL